ncbi:MAG: TIGR00730 family Rossman fold protein [Phycisphaerales bacterium]|nr:TIGR00730 family Rossman fold protein [Phycisphaerales bacterium]MCI0630928.1 TIGR00730 family Rossman fold protein [Phycisphaerales bacterium]MCI0674249.1 TIGR00730 family Rossman fold protein [Phycisphaerales bacterium]
MKPLTELERQTLPAVTALIQSFGGDPDSFQGRLITQLIQTSLKLIPDGHDTGQLKLLNTALKEMRYAYRVFNKYRGIRKITIFGSARTPRDHPDYLAARDFGAAIAGHGWMAITGAGDGIMRAGHEGPQREGSFGLSIRLPFETTANQVIEGDPKLINFRYFFTRKLMFMTHADAVAVFPGGFGTQDELFECLTLVQTGKSNIIPIVLLEGCGGLYWDNWEHYIRENLLNNGWISPEDPGIYRIASSVDDAVRHVLQFYRMYHSSRYVGDTLVIRLRRKLAPIQVEQLHEEFKTLLKDGRIEQTAALEGERDHLELPRLTLLHTRHQFGRVRALIDRINNFASDDSAKAIPRG